MTGVQTCALPILAQSLYASDEWDIPYAALCCGRWLLVALAFMIDSFCVDVPALSEEVRAKFGSITPFAAGIKGIGDAALGLMLPVLAGYIAFSIADRPGLAPGFVGGVIASYGKSGFMGALAAGFLAGYLMRAAKRLTVRSIPVLQRIAPVLL